MTCPVCGSADYSAALSECRTHHTTDHNERRAQLARRAFELGFSQVVFADELNATAPRLHTWKAKWRGELYGLGARFEGLLLDGFAEFLDRPTAPWAEKRQPERLREDEEPKAAGS